MAGINDKTNKLFTTLSNTYGEAKAKQLINTYSPEQLKTFILNDNNIDSISKDEILYDVNDVIVSYANQNIPFDTKVAKSQTIQNNTQTPVKIDSTQTQTQPIVDSTINNSGIKTLPLDINDTTKAQTLPLDINANNKPILLNRNNSMFDNEMSNIRNAVQNKYNNLRIGDLTDEQVRAIYRDMGGKINTPTDTAITTPVKPIAPVTDTTATTDTTGVQNNANVAPQKINNKVPVNFATPNKLYPNYTSSNDLPKLTLEPNSEVSLADKYAKIKDIYGADTAKQILKQPRNVLDNIYSTIKYTSPKDIKKDDTKDDIKDDIKDDTKKDEEAIRKAREEYIKRRNTEVQQVGNANPANFNEQAATDVIASTPELIGLNNATRYISDIPTSNNLGVTKRGQDVRDLQQTLYEQGYFGDLAKSKSVDAKLGARTRQAIRNYQNDVQRAMNAEVAATNAEAGEIGLPVAQQLPVKISATPSMAYSGAATRQQRKDNRKIAKSGNYVPTNTADVKTAANQILQGINTSSEIPQKSIATPVNKKPMTEKEIAAAIELGQAIGSKFAGGNNPYVPPMYLKPRGNLFVNTGNSGLPTTIGSGTPAVTSTGIPALGASGISQALNIGNALAGNYNATGTNPFAAKPTVTSGGNTSQTGKTPGLDIPGSSNLYGLRLGTQAAQLGASLIDNYNQRRLNQFMLEQGVPEPTYVNPVDLETNVDISSQLANYQNNLGTYSNALLNNTTNSQNAVNRLNKLGTQTQQGAGELMTNAYNTEGQLRNQEIMANSQINQYNANQYDDYKMNQFDLMQQGIMNENLNQVNFSDDITSAIDRFNANQYQQDLLNLEGQKYSNSGVFLNTMEDNGLKNFYYTTKDPTLKAKAKAILEARNIKLD